MKHSVRRQHLSVALFPFLAVLICTLGSLIVLLVLFTHQAKVEAKTIVARQRAERMDSQALRQTREELEDAQWRSDLLRQQREEKTRELADGRARLAHLEQHIQELQQRARQLLGRARQIDEGKQLRHDQVAATQTVLARLGEEISRRKIELEETRRKLQSQEDSYALIPYEGSSATRRRPIYIECTGNGIVLQPEGIVFRPQDFNGPMGPGNPLDAALRAIREYLQQAGTQASDPYPLLVVRPSGVVAYGAARSALKAWDDEFGYELISDQKRLDFGQADPALAVALQQSVAQARQRQSALVAAMPRSYEAENPLTSFDPASVPGLASHAVAAGGRGVGSGTGGMGNGKPGTSGPILGAPSGSASGNEVNYPTTAQSGGPGGLATSGSHGSTAHSAGNRSNAGGSAGGQSGAPAERMSGHSVGVGDRPAAGSQPGQQPETSSQIAGRASGGSRGDGVVSGRGRGSNWGLPGAIGRTTGITRPIRVAVLWDRLVLAPDWGEDRQPLHLRIPPRLQQQQVDAFVTAVQREMQGWGLAVEGGYWKPVLQVEVAPDAEHHFADLQTALQGSGFEIERKRP
jgi:hypothetical protein